MKRTDLILAALAPANGAAHSPVQLQKLLFLIDKQIPHLVGGPYFAFQPYDYGPFDKSVYADLKILALEGFVEIEAAPGLRWRKYRLTESGQAAGNASLAELDESAQKYVREVSHFVRALSFESLVSAIYKAFPEMKANSVFRG